MSEKKSIEQLTDMDVRYDTYLWTKDGGIVVLECSQNYDWDDIFSDDGYLPPGMSGEFVTMCRNDKYDYFIERMGVDVSQDVTDILSLAEEEEEMLDEWDDGSNEGILKRFQFAIKKKQEEGYKAFMITVYDHGGHAFDFSPVDEESYLFVHGWDTGTTGILFLKHDPERDSETEGEFLLRHTNYLNDILSGNVFDISIQKWTNWISENEPDRTRGEWEVVDSCCLYTGSDLCEKSRLGVVAEHDFGVKIDWERSGVKAKEAV